MKLTRFVNLLAIGLLLSFAAMGCRKNPSNVTNIPGHPYTDPQDIGPQPPLDAEPNLYGTNNLSLRPLSDSEVHRGWPENAEIFKPYTVYFDYDSAALRASERSKAASVADHLKANPLEAVRVEGNCDARGTEEYNRSLGERRALAAREELLNLGIDSSRVDTKSWGEDNPANDPGQNETAWKQNRRADFVLLTPPPK